MTMAIMTAIMITTARRHQGQGIGRHRHICAAGRIMASLVLLCMAGRRTASPARILECTDRRTASQARILECTGPVDRVLAECISPVRNTGHRPGRSSIRSTGRSQVVDMAVVPAVTADNHCLT